MRLKTINIKGFKSFADDTTLHFGEDVTGIVGPNGSGKSNIVDAIRWVLGEMKSRELRLQRMGDIIFNGTKKRKPAGVAKVSLTFENTKGLIPTEYNMITVSRLIYQSGESEYRLNDVVCRRKDIMNLFIDTGIGSNSYAIIGQGMVTEIIDDRDGSRRKMFEQAAGISKYKIRKRETFNKLASTEADLDRVEDLLFELERNLKDLERQAKRARKYKDLKAKYKEKSIELAVQSTARYKADYQSLKERLVKEKDTISQMRTDLHKAEAELEEIKRKNMDLEKEVSSSQRAMNELLDGLRQLESSKEIKKQRFDFLSQDIKRLEEQVKEAESRQVDIQKDLEIMDTERVAIQEKKEEAQMETEKAEREYDHLKSQHETAKADLSEYLSRKQGLDNAVFDLEKGKAITANKLDGNKLAREKAESLIDSKKREAENLQGEVAQMESKRAAIQKEIDLLSEKESTRKKSLTQLEEELEMIREKLSLLHRSRDQKSNEYKLLKSMVDNLEGFPESVRFLSQSWDGKKVLLSDIVECDKKYQLAVEAYLEPYLNHFIVDDIEQALGALSMLSQAQKGKAQFFLLDKFDEDKKEILPNPENSIRALDVIKDSGKYQPVIEALLKDVFISENFEFVKGYNGPGIMLHSDGGLIRRKKQVKGGSIGLFEGKKLGRKKEMEKLDTELVRLESEIDTNEMKKQKLIDEIDALRAQEQSASLEDRKREIAGVEQSHAALSARLDGLINIIENENSHRSQLKEEAQLLEQKTEEIAVALEEKKSKLDSLKKIISDRGGEVDQWVGSLSLLSEKLNRANRHLMELQNQESSLVQRIDFLNSQYKTNETNIREGKERIERETQEMNTLSQELSEIESRLIKEYESRGSFQDKLNDIEKVYYSGRNEIYTKEENVRKLNRSLMQQQDLVEDISQKYTDVRIKLRSITDRMEVEFGVTMEEILKSEYEITSSMEDLEAGVEKLRKRLDNFGEINPMALEAYEEMKLRYDNIIQQKEDILEARASLEATIKEIEETATVQFMTSFEEVKEHFREVFRSLFSEEDDCDLILSDPENPLESVIEVVARPKGKRPKTLSQLSGGEKALTAIALLFALYLLKPAPFCVFDEVDAPLDDVNVIKFNRIIRKFSDRSQFIVITHNKLTMAEVDILYGIYMEEQGVSNVSQVDFRAYDHELVLERS
ncbi:MAG: chromosome segregation protein SMC [Saprospiraceae bacterium]|nr:chromosome segregation protein SMC [Saprospiraceae bacterium]